VHLIQVGSLIIGTLKKTAEKHLKLDKPLKMAVMSVPADFGEEQRNATIAAAALAGTHTPFPPQCNARHCSGSGPPKPRPDWARPDRLH
jgi:hypothetical protein